MSTASLERARTDTTDLTNTAESAIMGLFAGVVHR